MINSVALTDMANFIELATRLSPDTEQEFFTSQIKQEIKEAEE